MITKLWKKLVNRETISYLVFGVLTTLVDWVSYWYMRLLRQAHGQQRSCLLL